MFYNCNRKSESIGQRSIPMSVRYKFLIFVLAVLVANGCAHKAPTIAHVHVGHALTGWHSTPDKEGFFVVAENQAKRALDVAQNATGRDDDIDALKADIALVVEATNPERKIDEPKQRYGVKQALNGAVNHIGFAGDSDDASENVSTSAEAFVSNATTVLDRCDLIAALGSDIEDASSQDEASVLAEEVLILSRANVYGEDSDGDGVIGSNPGEYGLVQLRKELDAMVDREDPPYRTVDSWYLFNLVRLPTGEWAFREKGSGLGGYDDGY
jgi:hypothetical protein